MNAPPILVILGHPLRTDLRAHRLRKADDHYTLCGRAVRGSRVTTSNVPADRLCAACVREAAR